ncbi:MAG: hypothetical protein EWV43_05525 [Microcystis panniformis Mp_MB_F_20080800_S26D]|nr:MAG: hypothetical protein EWV43_05525 [Microcystis panniformis Mp_MB_F_20080800_S26D]
MKMQGFEPRFSQNLAPVSREKPQNPYFAYISHLFSKPYLSSVRVKQRGIVETGSILIVSSAK